MKKALLLNAVIFLIGLNADCQTGLTGMPDSAIVSGPVERIRLFTDRTLYCVNETIYFTAGYSCKGGADSVLWSKVLYVELIKWNGVKLVNLKLKLDKSGSSASLRIPGDLLSGNYYLRAYTKWMRNFSTYDYSYRLIKIVNPFNPAIDAGPQEIPGSGRSELKVRASKELIQDIHCSMNKSQYQTRERAEVELYINDDQCTGSPGFCVSIAKAGSMGTSFIFAEPEKEILRKKWGEIEYLPEISGITLSGKIIDKSTHAPKRNLLINLSETKNGEFFSVYQTLDDGRFIFSLPDLYGKYDFFIQSEGSDTALSEFLIDKDFCNRLIILPYVAFSINKDEKQLIRDMMVNMQLNEKFPAKPDTAKKASANRQKPVPFYGSRRHTYYTEKYIELPNIEEFFSEIVPEAIVVHNKGTSELKISSTTGFSNYPPLVFLDNMLVDNDDRLLKIPLDRIERVEAIDRGYAAGNMKYSGLISIYSKNKDLAGIKLNKNSMFFAYDLLSEENSGVISGENSNDPRIPDRRNVLYWNPDIHLSRGEKTSISFYTSDNKGDYEVYIFRKNSGDCREVYGKYLFSVK
jgi:hypothetical protein